MKCSMPECDKVALYVRPPEFRCKAHRDVETDATRRVAQAFDARNARIGRDQRDQDRRSKDYDRRWMGARGRE